MEGGTFTSFEPTNGGWYLDNFKLINAHCPMELLGKIDSLVGTASTQPKIKYKSSQNRI